MTPREFSLLWNRHIAAERRTDRRLCVWLAMYANAHRPKNREHNPYTVDEFLPGAPAKAQDPLTMFEYAKAITQEWQEKERMVRRTNGHP